MILEIDPDLLVMNWFALGGQQISMQQLCEIRDKLEQTIPYVCVRLWDGVSLGDRQDLFSSPRKNIMRGYYNHPEEMIREMVNRLNLPSESRARINDHLFPALTKKLVDDCKYVFSQEYVDKNYNSLIPEEYRSQVLSIIKECYESNLIAPD